MEDFTVYSLLGTQKIATKEQKSNWVRPLGGELVKGEEEEGLPGLLEDFES